MKKIPSVFKRDFGKNPALATAEVTPGCEWVLRGEGEATAKWDGTACMVRAGKLYKRRDRKRLRNGQGYKAAPPGWEQCQDPDPGTGHWPGWMPVGDGPEDHHFRVAELAWAVGAADGTYELVGPKVQGNPHGLPTLQLRLHGDVGVGPLPSPLTFDIIRQAVGLTAWEGIVWHHPDGRMAKIKRRDFGLPWPPTESGATSQMEQEETA